MHDGPAPNRDLVLVGGGHTHVQLIRRWAMRPVDGVRLTVVVDDPVAVYSGMVPGFVAGDYEAHELEIDVVPLARRAGARVILAAAVGLDAGEKRLEVAGRPPVAYDVLSWNVGSTVRGLDVPGVREHALATRPIGSFVARLDEAIAAAEARRAAASADAGAGADPIEVTIVGAGAAGVELAFCLDARLRDLGRAIRVTVAASTDVPLPGSAAALQRAVRREAEARGITLRLGVRVTQVHADRVDVEGGDPIATDLAVWATGAAPHAMLDALPLAKGPRGFLRVGPTLEVEGAADVFAVGDCAHLAHAPWVPKAGVYAVREGPVLDANLRARLRGAALSAYRPQKDFLALLNLGGGRALGSKWGRAFGGKWVLRWKDWIDRRFMRKFQVLGREGAQSKDFPPMETDAPMRCGGCAAKVGASALTRALTRLGPPLPDPAVRLGLEEPDDVAAYDEGDGRLTLVTVDAFRAFADDPWLVGKVAAINAISDVQAKGATPRRALALVSVPQGLPDDVSRARQRQEEEALFQVLHGIRSVLDPLGVTLLGGHSTKGPELYVGLTVLGEARDGELLPLGGLQPGDTLLVTKPLGSGVLLHADMAGRCPGRWVRSLYAALGVSNGEASQAALAAEARAITDITGFGLAGHLVGMLRASGVAGELWLDRLPAYPGALALMKQGLRSTAHLENARAEHAIEADASARQHPAWPLIFDPQTAGGLLIGVPTQRVEATRASLERAGAMAVTVGRTLPATPESPPLRVMANAR